LENLPGIQINGIAQKMCGPEGTGIAARQVEAEEDAETSETLFRSTSFRSAALLTSVLKLHD
jgi:hypothetical protein